MTTLRAAAVIALALGSLTACSGDDGTEPSDATAGPTAAPTTEQPEQGPTPPTMFVEVEVTPGSDLAAEGAIDDSTEPTCDQEDGTWTSAGTVTNPTTEAKSYRVYVTFMRGNQIAAIVQADAEGVEPGASAEWSARFPTAEDGLTCVISVERVAA